VVLRELQNTLQPLREEHVPTAFCTSDPDGRLGAMTDQTLDDALFADVLSAETRTAAVTWP
jgi:hypothetical protein